MRLRVKDGSDGELELVKVDADGAFEALLDAVEAKLGFKPQSLMLEGARIRSLVDLEENDVLVAMREEPQSRKRPAAGDPPSSAQDAAGSPEPARQPGQMGIKLVMQDGSETFFKVRGSTKISKVLKAFNERANVDDGTYRYTHDGERVRESSEHTIEQLGIEDGDAIDVHVSQEGGRLEDLC